MNKTDIINSALNLIDAREIINIDEDTNEARIARRYYDTATKSVIGNDKWLVSTFVVDVPAVIADTRFNFDNVFNVPENVVKIITIYAPNGVDIAKNHIDYEKVGNVIYSTGTSLFIEASQLIPEEEYSANMTEAVILKLASLMAPKLTSPSTGLREAYVSQLSEIISMGINEIDYEVNTTRVPEWLLARRGGGDGGFYDVSE